MRFMKKKNRSVYVLQFPTSTIVILVRTNVLILFNRTTLIVIMSVNMWSCTVNLTKPFVTGYDWCLLDSVYIQNLTSSLDKQKWHRFFSRLGIADFITVRHQKVDLDSNTVVKIT